MRVECPCGSHLFLIHSPPKGTPQTLRTVYLICDGCRKIWQLKRGVLLEVDAEGVLQPFAESKLPDEREVRP